VSRLCSPSPGIACDHYHRYADDIKLLASLGLNTYRFSIEWARIEPEQGVFSTAELDHYRRMLAACHENNVTPMVTFYHFSSPRWFAALGGWEHKTAADLFVRYCERTAEHCGDLIGLATTFNEPNLPMLLRWIRDFNNYPFDVVIGMAQKPRRPWVWIVLAHSFSETPRNCAMYDRQLPPRLRRRSNRDRESILLASPSPCRTSRRRVRKEQA
jgi:hypothetical protein